MLFRSERPNGHQSCSAHHRVSVRALGPGSPSGGPPRWTGVGEDAAPVRVLQVDPSAFTPPYDHALCTALARMGEHVTLATSRFGYGDVPPALGYVRDEGAFYRFDPLEYRHPIVAERHQQFD